LIGERKFDLFARPIAGESTVTWFVCASPFTAAYRSF
jgi:hypothetical protein